MVKPSLKKVRAFGTDAKAVWAAVSFSCKKWITIVSRSVCQVGVAIDQSGQHSHLRKVDDLGVGGIARPLPNLFHLIVPDENNLIGEHRACLWINQVAGLDRCDLPKALAAHDTHNPSTNARVFFTFFSSISWL